MSSLNAAIRPTLRDVKHHPLRSLAAILLIALPHLCGIPHWGHDIGVAILWDHIPTEFRPVLRQRMPAKR